MPSALMPQCSSWPPHSARGHRRTVYPSSSLTDAQWAMLEPLLPPPGNTAGRGGRPEKHYRRMILDTILHLVRGRIAWRQLPAGFPPPTTVYDVFTLGPSRGWRRIHDALRDRLRVRARRDRCPTAVVIDSQTCPPPTRCPGPVAMGRRETGEWAQVTHRGGCDRVAAGRDGHRRVDRGPRCRVPTTRASA